MNADGSNVATVFSGDKFAIYQDVSWSPDGHHIAFHKVGGSGDGLWVVDVEVVGGVPTGTNARLLLSGSGYDPHWSPAGDVIAFKDLYLNTIETVAATGGDPVVVYSPPAGTGSIADLTWSPDASRIAFGQDLKIQILDLGTGEVTTALGPEWGQQFGEPRSLDWARTQDALAFCTGLVGDGDIFTMQLSAGTPVPVAAGIWPTWSPDDHQICFLADGGSLNLITLATGEITDLRTGGRWPDWRR
jgi:Tol biopolymer transport system component